MRSLVRAVLRSSLHQIRHVDAVPPGRAQGQVAQVYAQAERDFGVLAPPLALHSPAPAVLAASWLLLRETLLVEGVVSRAAKEVVATEVSRANSCPYCVDVHQAAAETLTAAPQGEHADLADWARTCRPSPGPTQECGPPPFTALEAPELCGVAVTFHYLNRMVSVFLADSPVPAQAPDLARGPILRTVARSMTAASGRPLAPGAALELLPSAQLPAGLEWAEGNPAVAGALARACHAVNRSAAWVPEQVRQRVYNRFALWNGAPAGPTAGWFEDAVIGLPTSDRPTAKLALLTAYAPYRVTEADVSAFRDRHPTDRELIELTSWAAMTTALRIGTWLPLPVRAPRAVPEPADVPATPRGR
ncbi:carboxymuconolactone decarboxylase family protein [Streptomyces cahuitamycinicus]|uniref:Alkylhydroperoxidase n=1 Tax=Streptomyces cahuitamycinicus TaxID=2070367 RepID=A0A2N8TWW2_9ACTN|nr:carboxymuconolactone decarboxylase family protein [Streptomyces cahuitamycinicus]PNG23506.1 alkylhydroperoxidase [Streptomyces cahuitamycinicus]